MASIPFRRVTHPYLALLFAISLIVPIARAQTAGALTGVYNGKYTCAQGPTNLKLSVVVSPIGDVSALFTFYLPAAVPNQGYTYSLHGQYDPQTAQLLLTPVRWETEHPANLGMVGMDGALSGDRLSGRITGGRCTTFDLARDKAETANIAAVITAQKNGGKPLTPSSWAAQIAAAQASAPTPATAPPPAAQANPPAAAPPASPSRPQEARGTQVANAQRPATSAAPQTGAKVPAATPQAGANPAVKATDADLTDDIRNTREMVTNPVLKWKMDMLEDSPTAGSSPHPKTLTFLFLEEYAFGTITATASCNQNGMSVFFNLDTASKFGAPSFDWYENNAGEDVTDVRVEVDGRSHMAIGFPKEDEQNRYINTMGIFFYKPDLAQQAAAAQRLQARTGTGLDSLIGPLVGAAAEAELNDAAASSGGPVTDLLNARSIRVDLSIQNWNSDKKPYLELNPQDPVLHKFVADCVKKFGIGTQPASGGTSEPDRTRAVSPAEARYQADPVPENAMRMQIAEITTRWAGYRVIATGTVSRVETLRGTTTLHFEPAGNQVLVCFPENTYSGMFGISDISELTGKTVEVRGSVTLPTACGGPPQPSYGAVVPGAIKIEAQSQLKLVASAVAGPAANKPSPAPSAVPSPQKEPMVVQNPDGTITLQKPAAEGQEGKGLVIPPQVVIPIVGSTTASDNSAAEAARARAAQEQQERLAREQQRIAQQQAAQQQARQRAAEAQRKALQAQACTQELMRRYPDGGRGDPDGFQKGFLACVQAQQAQPAK